MNEVKMRKLNKDELSDLRRWLIDNIFQNPDIMFSDEMTNNINIDKDVNIIEVVAWLYELLHREVTNEEYEYMFHWANKIGAWVETKDITKF